MYNVTIWYIYTHNIITIKLIDTFIISHSFYYFLVRRLKICLSKFWGCNTVLLITVNTLYIRFSERIHFILKVCTFWLILPPFVLLPPFPQNFTLSEFTFFFFWILHLREIIKQLFIRLISLGMTSLRFLILSKMARFPSFYGRIMSLCIYLTSLSIQPLTDT